MTKCGRKVDQERDETFSNIWPWTSGIVDDIWEEAFETLHAQTGKHLGETLSGTLSVHSRRVRAQSLQQLVDQVGEIVFAESFDERTEGFGRRGSSLGHRVDQYFMHQRHERVEVWHEISCFGERSHVTDNLDRTSFNVRTSLSETTVDDWHD